MRNSEKRSRFDQKFQIYGYYVKKKVTFRGHTLVTTVTFTPKTVTFVTNQYILLEINFPIITCTV